MVSEPEQSNVRKINDIADSGAKAYGIPGVICQGNDVDEVYKVVSEAAERARNGHGPTLVECKTYRWHTHFEGEPDTYRPPEEVAEWKKKDPIELYKKRLVDLGLADTCTLEEIERIIISEVDDAVEFARNSPLPGPETALQDVYA